MRKLQPPVRSDLSFLFFRLKEPSDLNCLFYWLSSRPLTISWPSSGFSLVTSYPCIDLPQTAPRTRGETTPVQSRAGQSPMLGLMSPRTGLPLGAARALLAPVPLALSPNFQVSFCGAALQPLVPKSVWTPRVSSPRCRSWHLLQQWISIMEMALCTNEPVLLS